MSHTPGPWTPYRDPGEYSAVGAATGDIAQEVRNEADARLIAAAPDLLRELRNLVSLLQTPLNRGDIQIHGLATLNAASAAIAKAEGK